MSAREQYWKYSLIIIIIALGVVICRESASFLGGVLGAITIYVLVRKQMFYLVKKKKMKKVIASILIVTESVLIFLIPLSLLVWMVVGMIQNIDLDTTALVNSVEHLSATIKQKTGYNLLQTDNISSAMALIPKIGQYIMSGVSSFGINVFILLFILYFMLISGEKMEQYIYELLPFNAKNKRVVWNEINLMVKSNAIGIPLLGVIQGVVALIGYWLFGVPTPVIFGILTAVATIIPVVGTALVWVPLLIYQAIIGDWGNFIGLALYTILIVTNIDNFIRFILQKKLADTHPLVTFFGVIIGISFFGFMGVIFGPILLSLFILCVNIFKNEYLQINDRTVKLNHTPPDHTWWQEPEKAESPQVDPKK